LTIPTLKRDGALADAIAKIHAYAREAGRDPSTIGIEGRIAYAGGSPDEWRRLVGAWEARGATHVAINTMNAGLQGAAAHIEAIRRFKEALS
jgi:hypothetical protein